MLKIALDDLSAHIGELIGHSEWTHVSQEMIQAFADATGDHQWIHLDVERAAAESPWKSTVAHGFLTASLIPRLNATVIDVTGKAASINYGFNKLRFPAAVRSGSDIRSRVELQDVSAVDSQRVLASYLTTIEIKGEDKPACVAECLVMYIRA
ncbi:MaoC family dehydratase [Marinobacter changyiensis]|uniref:MaoC family dehydratase n=1 Tax=Marinobacter changyiensis TaxID=2604091 RepID=UPI0012649D02|nr:MaoC family dehydratase [Marinobacter changyiensis]